MRDFVFGQQPEGARLIPQEKLRVVNAGIPGAATSHEGLVLQNNSVLFVTHQPPAAEEEEEEEESLDEDDL